MNYSKNRNLPEMPDGAIEWVAVYNTLRDLIEAGPILKITAGEALADFEVVQPPGASGKVMKGGNTDPFLGLVKDALALDEDGFAYTGVGNEVTNGSWSWTVGGFIYVGTTPGSLTQTQPTPQARPIGYANTATSITLLRGSPIIDARSLPISHHFMQQNVAASQTAVAIPVLGLAGNTEIVMPKPGSVVGISIASNEARSGGTLTVDITINGAATGLQAVLDGTNTQYHYATQDRRLDTFAAGDRLGVKITTDGSWAPTTADIVVMGLVEV